MRKETTKERRVYEGAESKVLLFSCTELEYAEECGGYAKQRG